MLVEFNTLPEESKVWIYQANRSFTEQEIEEKMFKDAEKGDKEVNVERTEQALDVKPEIIAAGCPFCNTMMTDGIKAKEKESDVDVMDIAELIANAQDL